MVAYLLRRLVLAFVTIWGISVVCFITIQLPPGDFASTYVEEMFSGGLTGGDGHRRHPAREDD